MNKIHLFRANWALPFFLAFLPDVQSEPDRLQNNFSSYAFLYYFFLSQGRGGRRVLSIVGFFALCKGWLWWCSQVTGLLFYFSLLF